MATTTVSIGSNQSISTVTPSSCGGSGPWVVAFTSTPSSNVAVGDIYVAQDESMSYATFTFLLTDISGSNYTLKYLSCDDGGMMSCGSTSPCDIYNASFETVAGTFKRAFSTITLFEGMIDDASPTYWGSTDDVVGECHGDSAFTDDSRVQFTNKQSLASVKLTVHEDDRHDGKAGTANKVVIRPTAYAGNSNAIIESNIDNFIVEWLEIDLSNTNTNKGIFLLGTNDDNIIRNNIIHSRTGSPTTYPVFGIHVSGATSGSSDTLSILNNIVYDFRETSDDTASGINMNSWRGTLNIYNNTVHNIESDNSGSTKAATCFKFNGHANQVANVKNNIASLLIADTAAEHRAYWDTGTGTSNVDYNLSDDTTSSTYEAQGVNSLIDKTEAEIDFVSVGVGTEDLSLNTDSVCREAGVDLGTANGVNIDIKGVNRDATELTWDIGAQQASTADADTGNPAFLLLIA